MNIYIIRHGETTWNKEEVFRGRKDIPLNETGKKQAERAGLYFSERRIDRIVSSPLKRAVETAEAIAMAAGAPIELTDDFTDMNFGIWEGLSVQEVEAAYPTDFTLWMGSPERLRVAGAETLQMVRKRVSDGLVKVAGQEESSIAVVTHRVICKVLVLHFLKIGNDHFWDMKFDPGSISLVEKRNDRFSLVFSNNTHLQREGTTPTGYRDF
jgi:phosphoserine phosphatase